MDRPREPIRPSVGVARALARDERSIAGRAPWLILAVAIPSIVLLALARLAPALADGDDGPGALDEPAVTRFDADDDDPAAGIDDGGDDPKDGTTGPGSANHATGAGRDTGLTDGTGATGRTGDTAATITDGTGVTDTTATVSNPTLRASRRSTR